MKLSWFAGVNDAKEKEELKQSIYRSREVLDRLYDILEFKLVTSTKADYESPSWSHKQADTLGYNRALTEVMNLINLEEKR